MSEKAEETQLPRTSYGARDRDRKQNSEPNMQKSRRIKTAIFTGDPEILLEVEPNIADFSAFWKFGIDLGKHDVRQSVGGKCARQSDDEEGQGADDVGSHDYGRGEVVSVPIVIGRGDMRNRKRKTRYATGPVASRSGE